MLTFKSVIFKSNLFNSTQIHSCVTSRVTINVMNKILKTVSRNMSEAATNARQCVVAVCQMTSTNSKDDNLETVHKLVQEAAAKSAKIVFLPEACDYIGTEKNKVDDSAESLDGPLINKYKNLAQKYKVWLSIGGFHEKLQNEVKSRNAHVLINDEGAIAAIYRKLHLFNVTIPEKKIDLKESDYVIAGKEIVPPIKTPAGNLALSICYDLRFPEVGILLRKLGADILTFPSAFTKTTGEAHWEVLLRSRAIENQCYVIAAAQYGHHNLERTSYGQAMIVDPWGKIIAECPKYSKSAPSNESVAVGVIDLDLLSKIRSEMPVFQHRRNDIYHLNQLESIKMAFSENYNFSDKVIPPTTVFYESLHCFAFTNLRCVVPGHVLITTKRVAKRLEDLTPEEVSDLFLTTVKVQKIMESVHKTDSSTICIQDGKNAGQTIPHVHVHILPRKIRDFENNDDIYEELARHDKENSTYTPRSLEEMSKEAQTLKKYFLSS